MATSNQVSLLSRNMEAFCGFVASGVVRGNLRTASAARVRVRTAGARNNARASRFMRVTTACVSKASAEPKKVAGPYAGKFGEWYLTEQDVRDVRIYRTALALGVVSAAAAALPVFVPFGETGWGANLSDAAFVVGAASLGVSLHYIHIYMKPMHDFLKGLFVLGAGLSCVSAILHDGALVSALPSDPSAMLAFGWIFAAATGLFFKETVCFGRVEALGLTLMVPFLSAGTFFQVLPAEVAKPALVVALISGSVFAANKLFGMEVEADLGDKSVFEYLAQEERK
ncbi:hypothetical protein FVE85_6237 [Porphyridium purpureum]|uniref:Uncharacterized protein n=1 Tax=Porphyridium purpureum TaxID=35688 RepID=A0A5J4Z6D1_PORPP|nr:hypothetical protein FVE85_6237 [Porphyridium purpureum]|eukprot:POR4665..scf295_1